MNGRDDLLKALKHYQRLYLKLSEGVRNKYHISQTEFDVVAFLNNHPDSNTAKDICDIRMLTKSNVSVAVDNLSKSGFLACAVDGQDRRVTRLRFLPKADSLREEVRLVQSEFSRVLIDGISQAEVDQFLDTLSKISRNAAEKMGEI